MLLGFKIFGAALMAAFLLLADDCSGVPTAEQIQNQQQQRASLQAVQEVGMPAITHYSEKRQLKAIFELRDEAISTVTYIADLNGSLHKLCDSVGYGIPYSTQYTNPQIQIDNGYHDSPTIPQPDPNGLYSPGDAEGTWVLCLNPHTKKTWPLYVEPRVVVSPFELQTQ